MGHELKGRNVLADHLTAVAHSCDGTVGGLIARI